MDNMKMHQQSMLQNLTADRSKSFPTNIH